MWLIPAIIFSACLVFFISWVYKKGSQKQEKDNGINKKYRIAWILFIAYIIDKRMSTFGDRWKADGQIASIKQWESKNTLDDTLSKNYGTCLEFLVQNNFVYASEWTGPGNVRQFTLCPSLQEYLFNCPAEIVDELQKLKNAHYCDLPF